SCGGPSIPPWLGAGAGVDGFAAGVGSGLLLAGGCEGSAAGCDEGVGVVDAGCAAGSVDGGFEITLCVNSRTSGTAYHAPAANAISNKIAMYQPLLELLPASKCGSTGESGTESGSMLFVGFASGTAFGSTGAGATATAVAAPALAAAAETVEP